MLGLKDMSMARLTGASRAQHARVAATAGLIASMTLMLSTCTDPTDPDAPVTSATDSEIEESTPNGSTSHPTATDPPSTTTTPSTSPTKTPTKSPTESPSASATTTPSTSPTKAPPGIAHGVTVSLGNHNAVRIPHEHPDEIAHGVADEVAVSIAHAVAVDAHTVTSAPRSLRGFRSVLPLPTHRSLRWPCIRRSRPASRQQSPTGPTRAVGGTRHSFGSPLQRRVSRSEGPALKRRATSYEGVGGGRGYATRNCYVDTVRETMLAIMGDTAEPGRHP